jgi:hypothetical protein
MDSYFLSKFRNRDGYKLLLANAVYALEGNNFYRSSKEETLKNVEKYLEEINSHLEAAIELEDKILKLQDKIFSDLVYKECFNRVFSKELYLYD